MEKVSLGKTKQPPIEEALSKSISSTIEENVSNMNIIFESNDDFVIQQIKLRNQSGYFVYVSGMVNYQTLMKIEQGLSMYSDLSQTGQSISSFIRKRFSISGIKETTTMKSAVEEIIRGNTFLMIDGLDSGVVFHTFDLSGREIEESVTEQTIRGPRDGFVESLHQNLKLIRQKIKTPHLKVEHLTLGKQTNTELSIVYINGIADSEIVEEVRQRLSRISIDGILESHYIESMIKDHPRSPVPTVYNTDRPDRVCGGLLEGKVAILVDGTPFVLTVPALFVEFLHTAEDYYDGSLVATFTRWVRFLGLFVTIILPGFYVAIASIHQDLLQTPFLIRIAASREALPYPILIEALFMLLTFELLREAGLRMPRPFGGPVVTILGLVLIGQAAVQAGIIGPTLAIVISVTALTSFILPNYSFHQIIRLSGVIFLLLAGIFGFMGIIIGIMLGLAYLVSLRSFGVPYFSPVSPARKESWKDVFIRAPWWAMKTRPAGIGVENGQRSEESNYSKQPHQRNEE